ncbi:MAG: hypothetical protein A7316_01250 [Candidatus Altiarchaeales archaeon WOR_SM1_86-2]|nr:MAG: hypothetical protein A7316_01250 [Candidatus Altiarchaeales archaeon WOR_SM1_86-2]
MQINSKVQNNKPKFNWNIPLYGAAGFGVGGAIMGALEGALEGAIGGVLVRASTYLSLQVQSWVPLGALG